jgi:hypothetical protein
MKKRLEDFPGNNEADLVRDRWITKEHKLSGMMYALIMLFC